MYTRIHANTEVSHGSANPQAGIKKSNRSLRPVMDCCCTVPCGSPLWMRSWFWSWHGRLCFDFNLVRISRGVGMGVCSNTRGRLGMFIFVSLGFQGAFAWGQNRQAIHIMLWCRLPKAARPNAARPNAAALNMAQAPKAMLGAGSPGHRHLGCALETLPAQMP